MFTLPSVLISALLTLPAAADSLPAPAVSLNDNRHPAGRLRNGVLTVELEAAKGSWRPEGASGPHVEIEAFAERGRAMQVPGPLLRVPVGTELRITLRNRLDASLTVRGLYDRGAPRPDSVTLGPGEARLVTFRVTTPGTYYYWGRTSVEAPRFGRRDDSQLSGAFVVDPASGALPDRILFMAGWIEPSDTLLEVGERREVLVINGQSWPHTERFALQVGDTVRWRVINGSNRIHPMHLHGFYFRVEARGTAERDTLYAAPQQRRAVTEFMAGGSTMSMTWVPTRPGNWLFHCHLIAHVSSRLRGQYAHLGATAEHDAHASTNHAYQGMAGLVVGMTVAARSQATAARHSPPARHALRLFVHKRARYFGDAAGYSFILQEGTSAPAPDSIRVPGTPIVLQLGEPVDITLINRTDELTSVHWHGIEVESYYDGVADWSGEGRHTAPKIAPGDSFVVRLNPDRAGTFIYHTHQDEGVQLSSGLYGPLIVHAPGATYDSTTDRVCLLGRGGPGAGAPGLLNGTTNPATQEWKAGTTYRLRFINITANDVEDISLSGDSALAQWQPFAKDGADIPVQQALVRPARQRLGPGETYDFAFTPTAAGDLRLEALMRGRANSIVGTIRVPIRVVTP